MPSKGMELFFPELLILTSQLSGCNQVLMYITRTFSVCSSCVSGFRSCMGITLQVAPHSIWKLTSFFIILSCWLWLCFSFIWFTVLMSPFASVVVMMSWYASLSCSETACTGLYFLGFFFFSFLHLAAKWFSFLHFLRFLPKAGYLFLLLSCVCHKSYSRYHQSLSCRLFQCMDSVSKVTWPRLLSLSLDIFVNVLI